MSLFKFKEFTVAQDRCAQKIGTDGVLLGAWVTPHQEPRTILDIGSGTGVISLMLAQRFANSNIEALEIEVDAYEQATEKQALRILFSTESRFGRSENTSG
jgi:tRNA1Val (adenine37-N6)-methyltransferase